MIQYPEKLPPPVRNNFSSKYERNFTVLRMDDGGRRPIRRWANQPREFQLEFHFTWDQLALFEGWVVYELKSGQNYGIIPIQDDVPIECQFIDDYNVVYEENGEWRVTARVRTILPGPVVPTSFVVLPSWPAELPELEKADYGFVREGAARSTVKEGWQDARDRWKTKRADVQFKVLLDATQREIFEDFVDNTLVGGLAWFQLNLAAGKGVETVRAQFSEPPTISSNGAAFVVSGVLHTFALPLYTEVEYLSHRGFNLSDRLVFTESLEFMLGRSVSIAEYMKFSESLSRQLHRQLTADLVFGEELTTETSYNRALSDEFNITESVEQSASFNRPSTSDATEFTESGVLFIQDYVDMSYLAEDYVGVSTSF